MSTRTGFPRMDWDTGFMADPKFIHLRDLLPDPIAFAYAGFCYLRLAADAWRTVERHSVRAIVRGIDQVTVDALTEAELLDAEAMVTQATFDKWVGSALRARQAQADKQARHRQSPSVTVTNGESRAVTKSLGPVGEVGQVETVGPDAAEVHIFARIAKAGAFIRPESGLGQRIVTLVARRGPVAVSAELDRLTARGPLSDRQIVFGLEDALDKIPTAAEARVDDREAERQKRNAKITEQVWERRLEAYRYGGTWDEAWGPVPEPVA